MAGFYTDVPGVRIPYHVDGSSMRWVTAPGKVISSAWTNFTPTEMAEVNDGDGVDFSAGVFTSTGRFIAWIFAQPIALVTGHCLRFAAPNNGADANLEYSTNTSDGTDGTWLTTPLNAGTSIGSALRTSITGVSLANVKGFRIHGSSGAVASGFTLRDCAFYGTWTPASLAGWHPTLDQQISGAHLDFGDVGLGQTAVKQFRIKNGRTLQANNVVVSPQNGTTAMLAGLQVSLDGSAYASNVTIPSIAAGAISPVIYLRRIVGLAETPGITGFVPVQFVATTWT